MLEKEEKIYLVILIISTLILVYYTIYLFNNPEDKYKKCKERPIIVYKI